MAGLEAKLANGPTIRVLTKNNHLPRTEVTGQARTNQAAVNQVATKKEHIVSS
jgi:hypothetical protein